MEVRWVRAGCQDEFKISGVFELVSDRYGRSTFYRLKRRLDVVWAEKEASG